MKNQIRNFVIVFLLIMSLPGLAISQVSSGVQKLNLVVSNVCDYYGQYVVCNGPDSSGISPSFGNAQCVYSSNYIHHDSLTVLNKVSIMAVTEDSPNPDDPKLFYIGDKNKLLSYYSSFPVSYCDPVIMPGDTFLIDSLKAMRAAYNKLFVIRETALSDNFLIYDTSTVVPVASMLLNMTPKFIDYNYNLVAIVGVNAVNEIVLNIINVNTLAVMADTVLGPMAQNPISILFAGSQTVYLASQPGDSVVNMVKYTGTISASTIYAYSGAHAFAWDGYYFHFQPDSDPSGNNLDSKVIKYDPFNMQQYAVFNTNRRFYKLLYGGGGGFSYYAYMHGVIESAANNQVIIYTHYNYSEEDSFQTNYQVDFIASDFRCPVSLEEYDDSRVKILAFPNPAGNSITINASGLICGRNYKMNLIDVAGKSWYEKSIHAKMSIEIPLETLPAGIYILQIHTLNGIVSEKIVKQ